MSEELEQIDAPQILGITEQQLNLLKTIYKLSTKGTKTTPVNIEKTYLKDYQTNIQKSNLFRQLKILLDKDFLQRQTEADYQINFTALKKTITERQTQYKQKLNQYANLSNQLENYFKQTTKKKQTPVVEYLFYEELFHKIEKSIINSNKYHITAKFPGIFYNLNIYSKIKRGDYLNVLVKKCFEKRDLDIVYLTPLDLDYPFMHSMDFYNDKEKAIRECLSIIDFLETAVEEYDNLKIAHFSNPYGIDVVIPEGKTLNESYHFLRDGDMNVTSGIHLMSEDTAEKAKESFMQLVGKSKIVHGSYATKICRVLRDKLIKI